MYFFGTIMSCWMLSSVSKSGSGFRLVTRIFQSPIRSTLAKFGTKSFWRIL